MTTCHHLAVHSQQFMNYDQHHQGQLILAARDKEAKPTLLPSEAQRQPYELPLPSSPLKTVLMHTGLLKNEERQTKSLAETEVC